ncbi:MAG: hypothetical protein ABI828_06810 [Actinomycetota bacterium]
MRPVRPTYRVVVPALLAAVSILASVSTASASSIVAVKTSPRIEFSPASNAGFFMWSQNSSAHPKHFDAFIQHGGGGATKMNANGSFGYAGGISSDGSTAVFQQVTNGKSDIELYDIATHTVSAPSQGVNTRRWEWGPTIDGNYLLFARNDQTSTFPPDEIVLYDLGTHVSTVLATNGSRKGYTQSGQISGDFAVYENCSARVCNVFRYQISTQTTIKLPNPHDKVNYGASVDTSGTVFYGRSGVGCGTHARLLKWAPGDLTPTTLFTPPVGQDFTSTFTETTVGGDELFFDRVKCSNQSWDIYKIVDP